MISCTEELLPEDVFENPLDEDEVTYETPALTFYPLENDVNLGTSFTVSVYGLGIDNLGGSYVRVGYDKTKLSVLSISVGDFFTDAVQTPFSFYENNTENSFVDIYTSFWEAILPWFLEPVVWLRLYSPRLLLEHPI